MLTYVQDGPEKYVQSLVHEKSGNLSAGTQPCVAICVTGPGWRVVLLTFAIYQRIFNHMQKFCIY